MAHNCIDWTTIPPSRKIPLLVLRRGDDRVYTIVPQEFKTLEDIVRKEFDLGDVEIKISSSCVNLCDGLPARITEASWEHVSAYIGCATVELVVPKDQEPKLEEQPPRAEGAADEGDAAAREEHPLNADEPEQRPGGMPNAAEARRDEEDVPSHHEEENIRPATPENQLEEPGDEEVSSGKPPPQQPAASEHEDEGHGSEREHPAPARSQASPLLASPPKPAIGIKKERKSDYHPEPASQPAEEPDKPIKQEKLDAGSAKSASHSQPQSQSKPLAESGDITKLMIRVGHRPSQQESKFTTKSTTKVHKVLASACRSFGLDASGATLYLIVSMEDEDGEEVENLFPCDRNDTIARAGADRNTESRFLLKIAGEA